MKIDIKSNASTFGQFMIWIFVWVSTWNLIEISVNHMTSISTINSTGELYRIAFYLGIFVIFTVLALLFNDQLSS
jgi:hypothetical protein